MFNEIQNNVAQILGVADLDEKAYEKAFVAKVIPVYQEVVTRVVENLKSEDEDAFEKLLDDDVGAEKLFEFLAVRIPHIDEIAYDEARKASGSPQIQ